MSPAASTPPLLMSKCQQDTRLQSLAARRLYQPVPWEFRGWPDARIRRSAAASTTTSATTATSSSSATATPAAASRVACPGPNSTEGSV